MSKSIIIGIIIFFCHCQDIDIEVGVGIGIGIGIDIDIDIGVDIGMGGNSPWCVGFMCFDGTPPGLFAGEGIALLATMIGAGLDDVSSWINDICLYMV